MIALDKVASRLALAKRFGADEVINVLEVGELSARAAAVREMLKTQGADFVMEVSGVPAVFSEGVSYLRPGGTYIVMGTISPGLTTQFDPGLLVRTSATIMGINRYPPRSLWQAMAFLARTEKKYPFAELLDEAFALQNAQEAVERSARRELQRATIVLSKGTETTR